MLFILTRAAIRYMRGARIGALARQHVYVANQAWRRHLGGDDIGAYRWRNSVYVK